MQIIDNRALLLKLRNPGRVTNVIPKSKVLPTGEVLVSWGLEEARVLKNLQIKNVPSPIIGKYEWPGMYKPFDHQRTTASFLTLHKRSFCFSEQGCVDASTEYLSPTGWRRMDEYDGGQVAQYHPDTQRVEFVEPDEYVRIPCDTMVRIKTKYGIDQLLSAEHRVLLVDGKRQKLKTEVTSAAELLRRHDLYHAGHRAAVKGARAGTDTIAFSGSAIPTSFRAPGGSGLPLTDAELRLQVAIIADGHFGAATNRCLVRVKKPRKVERMRRLLADAGVAYTEHTPQYESAIGFHVFKFSALVREKTFGPSWWSATPAQLVVIADEVLHWDGCVEGGQRRFSTSVRETADFVQYVFVSQGNTARITERHRERRGRVETEYNVQIRHTERLFLRGSTPTMSIEPSPDGFKYCFMVPSTFLLFRRNGCIFASGNTGKSASVIWASDYLLNIKAIKRVLIVCPVSVMQAAWVNDLFTFAMHRTVAVAHGYNKQVRIKAIQSGAEYVVINYDGLAIVADEIKKGGFDLIVADEASALKTATTKRWKTFHSLLTPDTWLWLLTGTPAAQSPVDAYGLAKLVNPSGTPKFFNSFKDMVMTKITNFKWIPKPDSEHTVHTLLQPAIRFTKEECLDLPEVTYTTRQVVLTPQQEKYYEMVRKSMRASAAGEQITAINAATCINKLLQISCGTAYTDTGEVVEFDASSRLSALKEVIDEASHKVLVFVPFRHTIDVVHDYLSKNGITNEVINGGVPSNRRNEIITDFQAKKDPQVLVIQPQAAAHGVTLTAANVVVWFAPTTSVETYLQANARTHRAGQRNPCTVVHLQGSPVEKRMYAMLQNNVDTHTKIVDLYKNELDGDES